MAALNSPKTSSNPDRLLRLLAPVLPGVTFCADEAFLWSPKDKTVFYNSKQLKSKKGQWSLLHEASHAALEHKDYDNDFELLKLEVAAWQYAVNLGTKFNITIDGNFVEDCLDSYRDWLHQRSTCPSCGSGGIQHDSSTYRCHNCHASWSVSQSRFCRTYRRKLDTLPKEKSPNHNSRTIFS